MSRASSVRLLVVWWIASALAVHAPAAPEPAALCEEGAKALQGKQYPRALELFRQSADLGHARAMNYLGTMHDIGLGVEADPVQALKWYRTSAEKGDGDAAANVAAFYEQGRGVARNPEEAERWYRKAQARGAGPRPEGGASPAASASASPSASPAAPASASPAPGAERVDPKLVGSWELKLPDGIVWTLEVSTTGHYLLVSNAPGLFGHGGSLEARDGAWSLKSSTSEEVDQGRYSFKGSQTLVWTGRLGTADWVRTLPPDPGNDSDLAGSWRSTWGADGENVDWFLEVMESGRYLMWCGNPATRGHGGKVAAKDGHWSLVSATMPFADLGTYKVESGALTWTGQQGSVDWKREE